MIDVRSSETGNLLFRIDPESMEIEIAHKRIVDRVSIWKCLRVIADKRLEREPVKLLSERHERHPSTPMGQGEVHAEHT